jgi:hypothetical protein
MLLPQTDPEQAITLCRRVRAQYESEVRPLKLEIPVTLDFGVAVHPMDGDQKSVLMGVADDRLYQLKQSGRTPSRVIPLDSHAQRETSQPPSPPPPRVTPISPPVPTPGAATASAAAPAPARAEQRKWERVSLAGTKAYAVLAEGSHKNASVIDLSYGGVALVIDRADDLSNQFNAVLHVPILPPVRVVLKKVYTQCLEGGRTRVGCAFVS